MTKTAERPAGGNFRHYALLHALLLLYSVYALLCKFAAAEPFLSPPFLLLYGGALMVLAGYALFWQVILKHLPLNTAFSNKAIVVVWGMLWGAVFFSESITLPKIIGAALVMAGIWLVVQDER
jgi:drug/metabolite transporter (DMT)-like permease